MQLQDISNNAKIVRLTKLIDDLQRSRTPEQTMRALQRGFSDDDEGVATMMLSTRGLAPDHYRVVRMQLSDDPGGINLDHENSQPVYTSGVVPQILRRPQPQLLQDVDWSQDPCFHASLKGYASLVAVPFSSARVPMNWLLLMKKAPQRLTISDLEDALERVAIGSALLENQSLAAELAHANEQIDREARQVGELQRTLLPAAAPKIAGLEIATSYEPTGRAGGDAYDFFPLDRDHVDVAAAAHRWCILIGDASGHGLAAAVVMAIVQAVLHAHPAGVDGPAKLLMHANRQLCQKQIGGFFTAFLGVYEPESRRLTYANAGHPAPLLRRAADGFVAALNEALNFPLGIDPTETFEECAIYLQPGDTVLFYTDGITETRDQKDEMFSQDRLAHVFDDAGDDPAEVIDRLRAAVCAHQQDQPATDDQTVVVARVL